MANTEELLKKQFLSYSQRAHLSSSFYFSDFLSLAEQSLLLSLNLGNAELFGGTQFSERKIAKFGKEEDNGYDEEYPITCILVKPKGEKFASELTHRDFLGAIMNLGITRDTLGDIVLKGNRAYVFALSRITDVIISDLERVSHTTVVCEICKELPDELKPHLEERKVNVASERADAIVSAVFKMSRANSSALFASQRIFVSGKLFLNSGKTLNIGDTVSVRGFGKFIYNGIERETKKGRLFVNISIYKEE